MCIPDSCQDADRFNHDRQADNYDADVSDESNPIRTGYAEALEWVADRSNYPAATDLLELGCGTGNLTYRLRARKITAVDVSTKMMALAAPKLAASQDVRFVTADVLTFAGTVATESLDVVASTYALHHLTDPEKDLLLRRLAGALRPGGRFAIADLMFADGDARALIMKQLATEGLRGLIESINEEFYWDLDATTRRMRELGFAVECRQISRFTWGVRAQR